MSHNSARRPQPGELDDGGFTVIEALVSFIVLAIVGVSATLGLVQGNTVSKRSSDRVNAVNLAQQDIQDARGLQPPTYPAAQTKTSVLGSTNYTVTRSVSNVCPVTPDLTNHPYMRVTTTVTWPPAATVNQVSLATEIAC
jgi:type II secretory pathway pseudopilin PulG